MLKRRRDRGDTLIEVLFAVSVFSFVVVGSLAIMNQGTAASQRSLEITLVRQQIDAQAETLRFMHDSYVAAYQSGLAFNTNDQTTSPAEEWYKMAVHPDSKFNLIKSASLLNTGATCTQSHENGSFVLDPRNVLFQPSSDKLELTDTVDTFSQVTYDSAGVFSAAKGIWIEPVRSQPKGDNAGFIDFHIRACWESSGMQVPSTQGTIVRLYEPRG